MIPECVSRTRAGYRRGAACEPFRDAQRVLLDVGEDRVLAVAERGANGRRLARDGENRDARLERYELAEFQRWPHPGADRGARRAARGASYGFSRSCICTSLDQWFSNARTQVLR